MAIQVGSQLLHHRRWCNLLQGAPRGGGGERLAGNDGRACWAAEAVAACAQQCQGHENPAN